MSYPRSFKCFLPPTLILISKPFPRAGTPFWPPFAVSDFTFAFFFTSCPSWRSRSTTLPCRDHCKQSVLSFAHDALPMRVEKQFQFWRFCTFVITNAPSSSTSGIGALRRASLMGAPVNRVRDGETRPSTGSACRRLWDHKSVEMFTWNS